jgi:hypothetical protein
MSGSVTRSSVTPPRMAGPSTHETRDSGCGRFRPVAAVHEGRLSTPVRPEVSKGQAEARFSVRPEVSKGWAEVSKPWHCWPRLRYLSPNGDSTGLRYLSPNGDSTGLRYLSPNGFFADVELRLWAANARSTVFEFHARAPVFAASARTTQQRRGSGSARPLASPPWGEAAKPLRGGSSHTGSTSSPAAVMNAARTRSPGSSAATAWR